MAATLQVTCQPSASDSFLVVAQGAGLSGYLGLQVVIGLSVGVPATLAGLTSPRSDDLLYGSNLQITKGQGGLSFIDTFTSAALGAVGNTVYAGIWDDSAVGGTAPLATAGPFVVGR